MKKESKNNPGKLLQTEELECLLEDGTLYLSGQLKVGNSGYFTRTITRKAAFLKSPSITFNLDKLEDIDSAGVMSLFYIKRLLKTNFADIHIEGGSASVKKKIELFGSEAPLPRSQQLRFSLLERIGKNTLDFINIYISGFLLLAANIFYWSIADIFRTKTSRKGEFINQSVVIGVNAAPIVIIMSFAIGLVMAVQSAQYLREFGADIFIVDLIVIAIMSQMGPLITAVLVAGRSGSSIAAEVASMKVSSELDALKTMGLDPVRYVVVPKLYASLFTIPLLVILANVAGIAGGATAAYMNLGITPEVFIARMEGVMKNKDLITAFVKSQVYASIIVLTGSFFGFMVDRGAEGVGRMTTLAVVVAISLVILADSIMAVIFY